MGEGSSQYDEEGLTTKVARNGVKLLNRRSRVEFASFAVGIVATLTISLISLALIQAGLTSALLVSRDSLVNNASVVNDSLKLRFTLSINSSALTTGEAIEIEVGEQNTLLFTNTVASANDWPITEPTFGLCSVRNFPMGFAIFKSYHLQNNLPSADLLEIYSPAIGECGLILYVDSYVFASGSNSASVHGSCHTDPCFTGPMQYHDTFKGYWSGDSPYFTNNTFHLFSPGVYTVVGGDEWGDLLVLHFVSS